MIIQRNYSPSALPKTTDVAELTGRAVAAVTAALEDGGLEGGAPPDLRLHLDWVHYGSSFRDPVMLRRAVDKQGQLLPLSEIAIDLKRADPARLPSQLTAAVGALAGREPDPAIAPV